MGNKELQAILSYFPVPDNPSGITPLTKGYINRSFAIQYEGKPQYVLQELNTEVFRDIDGLMDNFRLALPYLQDPEYFGPDLILTRSGASYLKTDTGACWRLISFVPDSTAFLFCKDSQTAWEAGHILGVFHRCLSKANPDEFKSFIPQFQELGRRFKEFDEALPKAAGDRLKQANSAIAFAKSKRVSLLAKEATNLPIRVCHNDTKMSNFLFSEEDGKALCLVDLDTIMPGYFHYDFGDALRTIANPNLEEECDPDKIIFNRSYCEAFISGLSQAQPGLSKTELDFLPQGAQIMPFLHGLRALTDFLSGDRYYRVTYPNQNLDRSLGLFRFTALTEQEAPFLETLIQKYFPS